MEVIYCALAFTGFASFFDGIVIKAAMELISFIFMLYLGIRFLKTRTVPSIAPVEEKFKGKLHPHSAFAIGFVRVMGNPGVFLFWIVLAALFQIARLGRGFRGATCFGAWPGWARARACGFRA